MSVLEHPQRLSPKRPIGFREFVAMMAGLMAVNALGIDMMLTALPAIGESLHVKIENDRQFVIAIYMIGFGIAQIIYGPLADHYGRRRLMLPALLFYVMTSFIAGLSSSFELLIGARFLQGVSAASTRILVISIVRDRYAGRQMARVMSLAFMVFLSVPIVAPTIGHLVTLVASWRWIFFGLGLYALAVLVWTGMRLPETLHEEDRTPISFAALGRGIGITVTSRASIGYTLASAAMFGTMMGFVNSFQQILADEFGAADQLPMLFGIAAAAMIAGAYVNSRIVGRFGTRRVSHTGLIMFITLTAIHSVIALDSHESIATLVGFQSAQMFCFSLTGANFSAMAMEPVGHIAGTASSVQGVISTVIGAILGLAIGQSFDGTTLPLVVGALIFALLAFLIVVITEKGKLFRPLHDPAGRVPIH